jgi:mannose-1-phosphate guanylyltransferase
MVPLAGISFIERYIAYLHSYGIDEIILATGSNPQLIRRFLDGGKRMGVRIVYSSEKYPLGTAGAVRNAAEHIKGRFLVSNGDVLLNIDLREMLKQHNQKGAMVTIGLTSVENPSAYGAVETDNHQRVIRFCEKPPEVTSTTTMINAGVYVMEPEVLDKIPSRRAYSFERQLFPTLLETSKKIYGYLSQAYFIDIGTVEKYIAANHAVLNGITGITIPFSAVRKGIMMRGRNNVSRMSSIEGQILMGPDCKVESDTTITGPSVLGEGCRIESGARLDGVVLWDRVQVKRDAVLRNCVIASDAVIGERCVVLDNCAIGSRVFLAADNRLASGLRVWPGHSLAPGTISF